MSVRVQERNAISREILQAARTYYVRTDGNDANTGLANSAGGAKLTLAGAYAAVLQVDLNGYTVTIQQGTAGALTAGLSITNSMTGGSNLLVDLGGGTLTVAGGPCIFASTPIGITVGNGTLSTTGSGHCISASGAGAKIALGSSLTFGACALGHVYANNGGYISAGFGSYTISGGALWHYIAQVDGLIDIVSETVNFNAAVKAFSQQFAHADTTGVVSSTSGVFAGPTITVTIASPGVVSWTAHGLALNDPVIFKTTGALPTGIVAGTTYFVKTVVNANSFQISATAGGAVINTSGTQSGVHNAYSVSGTKYDSSMNAVIYVAFAGANYLPGSVAGATATGGQYV